MVSCVSARRYLCVCNAVRFTSLSMQLGCVEDVQYADIDHYEESKVFTVDDVAFSGLTEYFDELRRDGMRTVIILVDQTIFVFHR